MSAHRFEFCEKSEDQARLVMEWRNDPLSLSMAIHREPKVWERFRDEFYDHYVSPPRSSCGFVIGETGPIAFLRFRKLEVDPQNLNRACCDVSIIVSPSARGQGLGTQALRMTPSIASSLGFEFILAEIRPENKASSAAFERAGYIPLKAVTRFIEDTKENCQLLRYGIETREALKGLALDFDGTLANSLGAMKLVYEMFLKERGLSPSDQEFESLNGPPLRDVIESLKAKYGLPDDTDGLLKRYQSQIKSVYQSVNPVSGAHELLQIARSKNLKVAIVTSNSSDLVSDWLRHHKLASTISVIVDPSQTPRHKPSPDPYLKALELLGLRSSEVLVVEDSYQGCQSAILAGLKTFALSARGPAHPQVARQIASLDEIISDILGVQIDPISDKLSLRSVETTERYDESLVKLVDQLWIEQCSKNSNLFNGQVLTIRRYAKDVIELSPQDFKFLFVQHHRSDLRSRLKITSLGVTGVVRIEDKIVFGRRSGSVTQDPLKWELVPAGTIDKKFVSSDGTVNWRGQVLEELFEEVGLNAEVVASIRPLGIIRGSNQPFMDLAIELICHGDESSVRAMINRRPSQEYIDFKILNPAEAADFVVKNQMEISDTTIALYFFWRSQSGRKSE